VEASIIIPAHNAEVTLGECIEACLAQERSGFEVIVVDDGSTDATPRIAQEYAVHYIRQDQSGPAAARNRGAQAARGAYLVYTDSDCAPESGWLARLLERFDEGTVAVGGTYTNAEAGNLLADFVHEEIVMRHATFNDEVDFLGSFNVAYRKDAFEAAGGFDESFKAASGEDNDLSYRLTEYGKLRFAPEARVAHHHPTRVLPYLRTQYRHGYWRVKLYTKHPDRTSGDRYARRFDLLAPHYAFFLTACCVLQLVTAPAAIAIGQAASALFLLASCAVLAIPYLAQRFIFACRVAKRARRPALLPFGMILLYVRDMARFLGVLEGLWQFRIREKSTS
jgi:glycosyltransferase involved in cell wall biosynthesis